MKRLLKITFTLFITTIIVLGFALPLNPLNGNWYQQFMPSMGGRTILDITFLDSLTGYSITSISSDTSYVLKTTNGGDIWIINYRAPSSIFRRILFVNNNTGFIGGQNLFKTTNAGGNWSIIYPSLFSEDMYYINNDTAWYADPNSFAGGVFFTSNGGVNWQQQFSGGNQNPNKIYMYNARIGFMSNSSALPNIYKTTNGGVNWLLNLPGENFTDMYFIDSLTGWRTKGDTLKYTSNGGINWTKQLMPYGGGIFSSNLLRFCVLNKDTLWGCGGYILYPNNQVKSIIYRTINGGVTWKYQIPDTSFLPFESFIKFTDKNHGWVYSINRTGIHTTNGGDTTFLVGIQQVSNEVPKNFKLYQNYPNPFNPKTTIKYQISNNNSFVQISVYDIQGKLVTELVNQKQTSGIYEVDFSASQYSSGVYFYKLIVSTAKEVFTETKKMILLK